MKPEPENKNLQKLYREILSEGIDREALRAEKNGFISLYFPRKQPWYSFRPVWTPALAFCLAVFAVVVVRPDLFAPETPAPAESSSRQQVSAPTAVVPAAEQPQPAAVVRAHNISISHLSSDVGTPVVYQRNVENVPVVVVWVFQNPGAA